MAKKRTSLDAVLPAKNQATKEAASETKSLPPEKKSSEPKPNSFRQSVKQHALYLRIPIHRQLRALAFEEEKKMHDLCLEGLDLLFANRGLPSIHELANDDLVH